MGSHLISIHEEYTRQIEFTPDTKRDLIDIIDHSLLTTLVNIKIFQGNHDRDSIIHKEFRLRGGIPNLIGNWIRRMTLKIMHHKGNMLRFCKIQTIHTCHIVNQLIGYDRFQGKGSLVRTSPLHIILHHLIDIQLIHQCLSSNVTLKWNSISIHSESNDDSIFLIFNQRIDRLD